MGSKDYDEIKEKFYEWYKLCSKKIPAKYRNELKDEAEKEFVLYEKNILKR